ncbi:uncharacterized protein LOC128211800 isoform X2 [Mya arenaria]|uniref:uncharacterized protein LOC128211800 isoform X2 n=1 Tax=Mya arenaria TaxID=6604 RepID=UPI0022DF3AB9|nr:uncharacterized protein LOC128211800 isoform X2 [Mya arenaria]
MTSSIIGITITHGADYLTGVNLGVVIGTDLPALKASELRSHIVKQVPSCPQQFNICTKQGWPLTSEQEGKLLVSELMKDGKELLINVKTAGPKIGVKNKQGSVIGFVHAGLKSSLMELKGLINQQILHSALSPTSPFHFLDERSWPISTCQEGHMTVTDALIGQCVRTNLNISLQSPNLSSQKEPPLKRIKFNPQLSFRSSKDLDRPASMDVVDGRTPGKQVLISYVRSEAATHALRLKEQLLGQGLTVYLDVHEIGTGVDWQDSLNNAVSSCEVFVPLVTNKYGATQWTNREVKLADVLGKYILPVSFLPEWPPPCLAIQFATTQFIPWIDQRYLSARDEKASISEWCDRDIKMVAGKISVRVQELTVAKLPSLVKRATVVKSCACLWLNNSSATLEDREGAPLVMICLHPEQHKFAMELKSLLVGCGLEVWCTTELDRGHMEHIDSLASSQEAINFSILNEAGHSLSGDHGNKDGRKGNHVLDDIRLFQEKADDASVVIFVLSEVFSHSRVCQQQVFYCEHRKRVIPVLYEDLCMPDWMTMLVGSHGLERSQDEDFKDVLIQRVKSELDPVERMKRSYSRSFSSPFSPVEGSYSNRSPAVRSPAIRSPATRSPAPFIGSQTMPFFFPPRVYASQKPPEVFQMEVTPASETPNARNTSTPTVPTASSATTPDVSPVSSTTKDVNEQPEGKQKSPLLTKPSLSSMKTVILE